MPVVAVLAVNDFNVAPSCGRAVVLHVVLHIQQLNRDLADKLIEDAKQNPQSVYMGKFVGIANGQIVVVADDLDELCRGLDLVEPDPSKTFWIEVGQDYDKVYEIWEVS